MTVVFTGKIILSKYFKAHIGNFIDSHLSGEGGRLDRRNLVRPVLHTEEPLGQPIVKEKKNNKPKDQMLT